jgi:hypothetical protein
VSVRLGALALIVSLPLGNGGAAAEQGDDEACAPPEPGFLTLDTAPWTLVYVDGAYAGSTPLFKHRLPAGAHTLTLVNETRGIFSKEDVVVEEGRARKLKLVLLLDERGAFAFDDSSAVNVSAEDCFVPEEEAAWLSVDSTPWSKVFVDGRAVGSTPIFKHAIPAGDHVVRLVRADGSAAFSRFSASAGEVIKLAVRLEKEPEDRP